MSNDICQWIETHADFVPEKLAVRFEGREITYRQLLSQIESTAAILKASRDIGRGDRIAYLGFNSPAFGADLYPRKCRGQDTRLR